MVILALDTTGSVCSAALSDEDRILAEFSIERQKTHSERLMPMVDALLRAAGAKLADVGLFACAAGPGSFTGIRIGVSAVKAFALAGGKPCVAVNTLDSLMTNVAHFEGCVCPLIDARRREAYNALYENGVRTTDYRACPLDGILRETAGKKTLFLGDGALAYRRDIEEAMGGLARFAQGNACLQRASSACLLAAQAARAGQTVSAFALEPFYIRRSLGGAGI